MQARMRNPVFVLPNALHTMQAFFKTVEQGPIPAATIQLVHLRASQINGCGLCVDMHSHDLKKLGERDERVFAVAAWRDSPFFTPAERAALALTEAVTRVADQADPVPDPIWREAEQHFDEAGLAAILLAIAQINAINRLNVATRQPADSWRKPQAERQAASH